MSSYTGVRRAPRPEDYTNVRCTAQFCSMYIQNQYYDVGIMLCQDHALDVWIKVQEMIDPKELSKVAYTYFHPPRKQYVEPEPTPKSERMGTVYYLRIGEFIKIGFTTGFSERMKAYPPDAELIGKHHGTYKDEQDIHKHLGQSRAHRREWYHHTKQVEAVLADIPQKTKIANEKMEKIYAENRRRDENKPRTPRRVIPGHEPRGFGDNKEHRLPPVIV